MEVWVLAGMIYPYVAWFFIMIGRGLLCYAGPARGPGFETREPTCIGCGYILLRQRRDGLCSECGSPIRASACWPRDRMPAAYWRVPISVLRAKDCGHRIAPRAMHAQARRFWLLNAVAVSAAVWLNIALIMLAMALAHGESVGSWLAWGCVIVLFGAPLYGVLPVALVHVIGVSVVCWWQVWVRRCRDIRMPATVAMFSCGDLWIPVLFMMLMIDLEVLLCEGLGWGREARWNLPYFGPTSPEELIILAASVITLLMLAVWLVRTGLAYGRVRYSNF
jgi:hypothetical protein